MREYWGRGWGKGRKARGEGRVDEERIGNEWGGGREGEWLKN